MGPENERIYGWYSQEQGKYNNQNDLFEMKKCMYRGTKTLKKTEALILIFWVKKSGLGCWSKSDRIRAADPNIFKLIRWEPPGTLV